MKAPVFTCPLTFIFLPEHQCVRTACLLLFFFFGLAAVAPGQTKGWDKTYGSTEFDAVAGILATPDGGYLLGGTSDSNKGGEKSENGRGGTDYWILKIDGFGKKQWDKTLGGDNDEYLSALVATPDGGYLLAGSSKSGVSGDKSAARLEDCTGFYCDDDFWIVKVDAGGQKLWDKAYGDSIAYDWDFQNDRPIYRKDVYEVLSSLVATPDGGFLLGGTSNFKIHDWWVVKTDSQGNQQWSAHYHHYPFSGHIFLSAMVPASDGGYLLGGTAYTYSNEEEQAGRGENDFLLVKIDGQGNQLWNKAFGGNDMDGLVDLVATPDGGYLLGGYSASDKGGDKTDARRGECPEFGYCPDDYWLVKTDSQGNKIWDKAFGGTNEEVLLDLLVTTEGHYLIGGNSASGIGFEKSEANIGGIDYWLLLLDASGNKIWDKTLGGREGEFYNAAIATPDAGYLLAGSSYSNQGEDKSEASRGNYDYWLVKLTDPQAMACTASGSILREYWRNSHGIRVRDIPQHRPPTSTSLLALFEGPSNLEEEYASRISGYICAPQTGFYTFWIAGDNETQLWLSPDDKPAHKVLIAGHPTWTAPRSWFESINQQSAPIALAAGQRYYIEALHKEGTREDHVAVAWQLPDGKMEAPIPGSRLSPAATETAPSPLLSTRMAKEPASRQHASAELQVFPNPFSTTTTLAFISPEPAVALLEILSLQGSLVQTLYRGQVKANTAFQYELAGSRLASGVYLARLMLNGKTCYRRLVINK